jgi:hypothetical protein
MNKIPYLMHQDALKLKETAESLLEFNTAAHITVSCTALLSLIEQAHSPQLGLATTKEIREEIAARGPDSPDDYRTFGGEESKVWPAKPYVTGDPIPL